MHAMKPTRRLSYDMYSKALLTHFKIIWSALHGQTAGIFRYLVLIHHFPFSQLCYQQASWLIQFMLAMHTDKREVKCVVPAR